MNSKLDRSWSVSDHVLNNNQTSTKLLGECDWNVFPQILQYKQYIINKIISKYEHKSHQHQKDEHVWSYN